MKKIIQRLAVSIAGISSVLFLLIGYYSFYLPETYTIDQGSNFSLENSLISATDKSEKAKTVLSQNGTESATLSIFGLFPIKEVSVTPEEPVMLIPSGKPFGVKMLTEGAMIVGFSPIASDSGYSCPGKEAGLKEGDTIIAVNQKKVSRNEEVAFLIEKCNGKTLQFTVERGGKTVNIEVDPVLSKADNRYKSGVLIRDSAAGIGTITYLDPENNLFAGLGHAICDVDTGEILSVGSGEVCDVDIYSIKKGCRGIPGELLGTFSTNVPFGNISKNNQTGIYGELFANIDAQGTYPMARKQEVQTGNATILCQLTDDFPQEYAIKIESIDYHPNSQVKNMVIKVIDKKLLNRTGGIVQGMSGSPVLQNGRIVGAVTHVLVNDPTRGYGIFIENMLEH